MEDITSAASAARLLASTASLLRSGGFGKLPTPPRVRGGPPTLAGTDERSG